MGGDLYRFVGRAVAVLAMLAVIAGFIFYDELTGESRCVGSQAIGDSIVAAISEYRRTHSGKPPARLEDLVPDFLREVPKPLTSPAIWDYRVLESGDYRLECGMKGYPKTWCHGKEWYLDH
jgi:hypothetical protein